MTVPRDTKRAILDLAESLLQNLGFNGFSYAHISSELKVKNAAIHYHFPSKEDLGCAVIRRYRERFRLWTGNARVKDLPPSKKLDWFFGIYTTMHAQGRVCLVGSLETEFNTIPASLQEEAKSLNGELLSWLEATLQEGREAGVFRFSGDPSRKAVVILSSFQGGLQMARALGAEKFNAIVEQHKQDLRA